MQPMGRVLLLGQKGGCDSEVRSTLDDEASSLDGPNGRGQLAIAQQFTNYTVTILSGRDCVGVDSKLLAGRSEDSPANIRARGSLKVRDLTQYSSRK